MSEVTPAPTAASVETPAETQPAQKVETPEDLQNSLSAARRRETEASKKLEETTARLQALEAKEKEREEAELSEIDKARKALEDANKTIADLEAHKQWRTEWETKEAEAITAEMDGLTDSQKGIVEALPLDQRRVAITEFKGAKPSKGGSFGMKTGKDGTLSVGQITEMAKEKGYNHPDVKAAYAKLRSV